jgi:hypothetical protein
MTDLLGTEIPRYPLITSRLGPATSLVFTVSTTPGYELVTLAAHGLSVGESIPIQIQAVDNSWGNATSTNPLNPAEELPVALTYGANVLTLYGLGNYRVVKSTTELPASVTLYR